MPKGSGVSLADAGPDRAQPHQILSDKYELLRVMSSGGMGSIWAAHHLSLDNQVAIKLLRDETTSDELRQRLIREAQLAARIEHPNIVRVLDLGFTDWKAPYLVMELLDGRDLGAELEEFGRLSPVRAVQLLLPVLEGLASAHDRNIAHRDLKPENIFLDRSEGGDHVVPKIVDFGIARCLTEFGLRRITNVGSVFGTVHYLSPEQALGKDDVDHRADIWGVCAVLYECITGLPPFGDREPALALRAIILEDVPPPSQLGVDTKGLEPLLMRGLHRDRELRWPGARSLGQALGAWLIQQGVHEDASAHGVRSRWFGSISDTESSPPPGMSADLRARRAEAVTLVDEAAPARRGRHTKWIALVCVVLFSVVSGAAYGGARRSVPELRRAGDHRNVRIDEAAQAGSDPAADAVRVEKAEASAAPSSRAVRSAPANGVSKTQRFDPVLGF